MAIVRISQTKEMILQREPYLTGDKSLILTSPSANSVIEGLFRLELRQINQLILRPDDSPPPRNSNLATRGHGEENVQSIGLYTSGTTGNPELHFHPLHELKKASKSSHPGKVWGLLYQPFRMAGLQVILQAWATDATLVEPEPGSTPLAFLDEFIDEGVDSLSGTPSRWRSLLSLEKFRLLPLKHITLGGEIADQVILDKLSSFFPLAEIRHVYATTETGPVFSVSDRLEGFPVSWMHRELSSGKRLSLSNGELVVSNGQAAQGGTQKVVHTGDLISQQGDRFRFIGRSGDVVKVGGVKVSLSDVEKHCNAIPGVADTLARAISNPFVGAVIQAELQWKGQPLSDQEVRKILMKSLPKPAIPAVILSVETLDLSDSFKKVRKK